MRKAVFKSKKIKTNFGRRLLSIREKAIKNGMSLKSADEILNRKENKTAGWANSEDLSREKALSVKSLLEIRINKIKQKEALQRELHEINNKLENQLQRILSDNKIKFYYFNLTHFSSLCFTIAIPVFKIRASMHEKIIETENEAFKVENLLKSLGLKVTNFEVEHVDDNLVEWKYILDV